MPSPKGGPRGGSASADGSRSPATQSAAEIAARLSDLPPVTIPDSKPIAKEYEVLLHRNLFAKSDKKKREDAMAAANKPTPPPAPNPETTLVLRGMSVEDDGLAYGFVENLSTRQTQRVGVGDKIGRGEVTEVTLFDIVYTRDGNPTRVAIGHTFDGRTAPMVAGAPPQVTSSSSGSSGGSRSSDGRSSSGNSSSGDRSSSERSRESGRGSSDSPTASTSGSGSPSSGSAGSPAPATSGGPPPGGSSPSPSLIEQMRARRAQEGGR